VQHCGRGGTRPSRGLTTLRPGWNPALQGTYNAAAGVEPGPPGDLQRCGRGGTRRLIQSCADPPAHLDPPGVGFDDPVEHLEQRALPSPVVPDQPQALAALQLEGDITDRPELVLPQRRKWRLKVEG